MCAEPLVVVVIGPGGVGKGTLARRAVARDPGLTLSRSWTTRPPRAGEHGDEYVFVDRETFERAVDDGYFLEWAQFQGNLYGTPRPNLGGGGDVLLEIEAQGAEQVRHEFPDAVIILVRAPSLSELEERLRARGDPEGHVQRRLASTATELSDGERLATHVVINDDVERATDEILSILEAVRRERRAVDEGLT
ncbi:MAG: guanylate kinase [Acidimicrobiales bacterium]